jgi:hypothetical protein
MTPSVVESEIRKRRDCCVEGIEDMETVHQGTEDCGRP